MLNLNQSTEGSNISNLVEANNLLFFTGNGTTADKIWKSDGTAEGTVLLSSQVAESTSATPDHLIDYHGFVLFTTEDNSGAQFWVTDGTETSKLFTPYQIAVESDFTVLREKLYFEASSAEIGSELFSFAPGIVILGIETKSEGRANVYPNPVRQNDIVTIEAPAREGNFQLLSIAGTSVKSTQFSESRIVLSTSELPAGMYVIKLNTASGSYVSKLIVK